MRRALWMVPAVLLAAIALGLAGVALAPRAVLERGAGWAAGRAVRIEAARLTGLASLELSGVAVANASWGSTPDLLRAERLELALDAGRLLRGEIRVRRLSVDGLRLVLEHDAAGRGNWKSADGEERADSTRPWLPTILDLQLRDALLLLHTSSGAVLRLGADRIALSTAAADQPVALTAALAYGDAPIALEARLDSFDAYRDAGRPFGFSLAATGGFGRATLEGTADRPLDFDTVAGRLHLASEDLGRAASMFGAGLRLAVGLEVQGDFTHGGDIWRLESATGVLAGGRFTGKAMLDEGTQHEPDAVQASLAFDDLDLDLLLRQSGPADSGADTPIAVPAQPQTLLDADVSVARLGWRSAEITALRLRPRISPGRMALDDIGFTAAGGRVTGDVSLDAVDGAPRLSARLDIAEAEARALLRAAGTQEALLTGRVTGRVQLSANGASTAQARRNAVGQVVLAMGQGQVSRDLVALASTDLRRLFGPPTGFTRLSCLLAVLDMREGFGVLTPFRIRTAQGTVFGGGVIDLGRASLDLTIKTASASTGVFALDVPVRITGPMESPSIRPVINSDAVAIARQGVVAAGRLPEPMRGLALGSPCLR